ncbi:MAG TPA: hypothetical protein VGH43_00305 [Jatrophihabitans sp.]|jgi:hypothetical protein
MTCSAPWAITGISNPRRARPLDIGDGLDLLATAARDFGGYNVKYRNAMYSFGGQAQSIVGRALLDANLTVRDLEALPDHRLRDLYRAGLLPVELTLGAVIVLDAAQRSENSGSSGEDVLADATAAAARFLDLIALAPEFTARFGRCGARCDLLSGRASKGTAHLASPGSLSDTPCETDSRGAVVDH